VAIREVQLRLYQTSEIAHISKMLRADVSEVNYKGSRL
jgi:hypothetical protein